MCGIWSLITKQDIDVKKYLGDFWNIKHRGPDNSQLHTFDKVYAGFHRLAIIDTSHTSNQPYIIQNGNRTIVFICNGEIYNYRYLDERYNLNCGNSDCKVIPALYILLGKTKWLELFSSEIIGEYAFMMFEFDKNILSNYFIGRDAVGVRPLYTVKTDMNQGKETQSISLLNEEQSSSFVNYERDNVSVQVPNRHDPSHSKLDWYSSEIKGLSSYEGDICEFTPGTIKHVNLHGDEHVQIYNFTTIYSTQPNTLTEQNNLELIKTAVINSVKRRLCSDRPIAFLLSGGVDSSLVAAIGMKILGKPISTFCCGIKGSTDMMYAKKVAEYIGSIHTEVYFTEEEGLELIERVVETTETWDTTTIRASIGQYIVSRYIAMNTDCKVVLVGEGPDEVCSSYLFNYYAPNATALHNTALEYVKNIHMYDGRRADRCIAKWGMEARVPLLDPEFITTYWGVDPLYRLPSYNIEKYMLRKAFENDNLLPSEVLWRKKEAFSDGVSSKERSWYSVIQEYAASKYTKNTPMENIPTENIPTENIITENISPESIPMKNISPENIPMKNISPEATLYKDLFLKYFGEKRLNVIPNYWQPKWDKNGNEIVEYVDPSARTLDVYKN